MTRRQKDGHHGNSATIRSMNASRAKNRYSFYILHLYLALPMTVAACSNFATLLGSEVNRTSLPKGIWEEGRRAASRHCCTRTPSPLVTMARPKLAPKKYPFPTTDPQAPLPALSLDPSDLRCQTESGSDPPFFHNAVGGGQTDAPTDRPTHRPTDRPRYSLITIGRCATRATRPKN